MSGGPAVVVAPCVPGSAARRAVMAHAAAALFGPTRSCSAPNTQSACFAAEWCDRGHAMPVRAATVRHVSGLLQRNTCYVALDGATGRFLGIAALSPAYMLHTLCVVDEARGRGVGKALLDAVLWRHGRDHDITLTVAGPRVRPLGGRGARPAPAARVLRDRHDRLVRFYETCGFRCTGEVVDAYTHMRRRCRHSAAAAGT